MHHRILAVQGFWLITDQQYIFLQPAHRDRVRQPNPVQVHQTRTHFAYSQFHLRFLARRLYHPVFETAEQAQSGLQ